MKAKILFEMVINSDDLEINSDLYDEMTKLFDIFKIVMNTEEDLWFDVENVKVKAMHEVV